MTPEEILKQAKEIEQDLKQEEKPKRIWIFIGLFLVMIMVLYLFPYHWISLNPEPNNIPSASQALAKGIDENLSQPKNIVHAKDLINPHDQKIKLTANKIVTTACDSNQICYSKALYYFIRDNYDYVKDPIGAEYVEDPKEFLAAGGGDCESGSIALAALQEAIGTDTQLVLIANHAYVRIKLAEAPKTYKNNGWIYLDWTCKDCDFGEIPWQNWKKRAQYIEI